MAAAKSQSSKQAKTSMIIFIVLAILFFGITVIYTIATWDYMVMGKTVNLNEYTAEGRAPEEGEYATLNVRFVLGNYAETKHTYGFIPIGTEQHYAIILEDGSIMSLTVKSGSDIDKLEAMVDPTWAYLTEAGEYPLASLELTGKVKNMDSKVRGFYKDALNKVGATTSVFPNIYELTLDATDSRLFCFIIAGVLLLLAIGCIALVFASKKKLKELKNIQAIAKENAADPTLNPFLQQNGDAQSMYNGGANDQAGNPAAPFAGGAGMAGAASASPYAGGVNMPGAAPASPYAGGVNMPEKPAENPYAGGIDMPGKPAETDQPAAEPVSSIDDIMNSAAESENTAEPNDGTPNTGYDIPEFDPFAEFGVKKDDENQ